MKRIIFLFSFLSSISVYSQTNTLEIDYDQATSEYIVNMIAGEDDSFFFMGSSQISIAVCNNLGAITVTNANPTGGASWVAGTGHTDQGNGWNYQSYTTSGGSFGVVTTGDVIEMFRFTVGSQPSTCATFTCSSTTPGGAPIRLFIDGSDPNAVTMSNLNDYQHNIFELQQLQSFLSASNAAFDACPLPVELLSFDAAPSRSAIELTWATASETNNSGFEIYRSINPRTDFEKIGWVEGAGNSANKIDYQFMDETVRTNIEYYYKLKQIDFDGAFEFSDVESAKITSGGLGAEIRPNPAKQSVEIVLNGDIRGDINVSLIDIQGRMISSRSFDDGNTSFGLDVSNLPAGVYMVKIQNEAKSIIKKLVVE